MSSKNSELHNNVRQKLNIIIIEIITADLTIGKTDNDEIPFTSSQIDIFIINNKNNIEKTVEELINIYEEDGELETLLNPLYDWIREILYEYVDTNIDIN